MVEINTENPKDDVDVILYLGAITTHGYMELTRTIESCSRQKKVLFVLITNGGDPNAGYRIARALGHYYPDNVTIGIPSLCKSAGTLICIGANELVVADRGELGPLDIQLSSKDELMGMSSGLDIMQALSALQETMNEAFKRYLLDLRFGGKLGTKMASDIASSMAIGLITPLAQQIDPIKLAEHQRALNIAVAYGDRLNKQTKNTTGQDISRLLTSYPAHGFVIDRKEIAELFKSVRSPTAEESCIFSIVHSMFGDHGINHASGDPKIHMLKFNECLELVRQHEIKNGNVKPQEAESGNDDPNREAQDVAAGDTAPTDKQGTGKRKTRAPKTTGSGE